MSVKDSSELLCYSYFHSSTLTRADRVPCDFFPKAFMLDTKGAHIAEW